MLREVSQNISQRMQSRSTVHFFSHTRNPNESLHAKPSMQSMSDVHSVVRRPSRQMP